jgi:hypothetical protein
MKHESSSNHEAPPVFDPVRELTINGEKITIRELPWPQALKFTKMLVESSREFAKEGKFEFTMESLPALVINAGQLSTFMILQATGRDEKWLEQIPFSSACEILDAALAINLSPEVLGKAKKAAGRFAQAIGVDAAALATKKPSEPASTS